MISVKRTIINERTCKHDGKFLCESLGSHYAFVCPQRCGYWMKYDPELFPGGVSFPSDFKETQIVEQVKGSDGSYTVVRYSIFR